MVHEKKLHADRNIQVQNVKRKVVPRHCASEKYDGGHPPRRSTLPTTVTCGQR
jgi:hypothetical protein